MKAALLLVDLQSDFLNRDGLVPDRESVLKGTVAWLRHFREAGLPVMHVRTVVQSDGTDRMPHWMESGTWLCVDGSAGAEAPAELAEQEREEIFPKTFYSGFENPALSDALDAARVDTVVVAGLYTHACVRATALDAYARGYRVQIAGDAVASAEPVHAELSLDYLAKRGIERVDLCEVSRLTSDGPLLSSGRSKVWELRNPARCAEVLDQVPIMGIDEAKRSTARAEHRQRRWAAIPLVRRKDQLARWVEGIAARRPEFVAQIVLDVGKPIVYAEAEFGYALDLLRHTLETLEKEANADQGKGFKVRYAPVGTVGIITPWNNPLAIPVGKIAPALAWGNGVVWKPALPGTRIARLLLQVLRDVSPEAPLELLTGDDSTGSALLISGALDAVSFTGSTRRGAIVAGLFSDRRKPLQAELGGNNAVIVAADADMNIVASLLAPALFGFSGQRCTAPRRVIVERSHRGVLERALLERIAELRVGEPTDAAVQVGPLVSTARQEQMARIVANADGRPLCGGNAPGDLTHGAWFLPTLIGDPSPDAAVVQKESFGPIAVLMSADDISHALQLSNAVRHGLVTTVFSENERVIRKVMNDAQSGIVAANVAPVPIAADAPFVGWKESGFGPPEHGRWDREFYTKSQARYPNGVELRHRPQGPRRPPTPLR